MRDIHIASVTMTSPLGKTRENLNTILKFADMAANNGADLICFPELCLTGYASSLKNNHIPLSLESSEIESIQQFADQKGVAVLAGFAERSANSKIYASHLVAIPKKKPAVYRKLHIAPPEKESFIPGDRVPVFDFNGFVFGIQLCYDAHFPMLSTKMTEKGVDAIFIPHASPRNSPEEKWASWMRHLPARAYDNSVFIIACNQNGENGNGLKFPGVSIVIDPSGHEMAKDLTGQDGILYATLRKDALDSVRGHSMRYFFPNSQRFE